jgi:hypothetical protein
VGHPVECGANPAIFGLERLIFNLNLDFRTIFVTLKA